MKKQALVTTAIFIPLILALIPGCDLFFPPPTRTGPLIEPTPSPPSLPALTIVPTPTPPPDGNMIFNHDFSSGPDRWSLYVDTTAGAEAHWETISEEAVITITEGSDSQSHIQFQQKYLSLVQDKTYRLSFRARAASRTMYVELGEDGYDNNNDGNRFSSYGGLTITLISATQMATYYIYITMTDPPDSGARLIFHLGGSNEDVVIDDVRLIELP
ncbi:MAG: carbohydrate binding domain-containing protein [Spirochaetales bacterium]|nr:carbohydrate binding domain-containing protein [Spirochaetales bacterium]